MTKTINESIEQAHEASVKNWSIGRQVRSIRLGGNEGHAMVEFSLVLPVLLMVVTGVWQFGVLFNHYISLTQATTAGAQALQTYRITRGNDPCAYTYTAIVNAAPTLDPANVSVTISMNNGAAITKNTCSGQQTQLAMGGPVTVQATYPYSLKVAGLSLASGSLSSGTIAEISY